MAVRDVGSRSARFVLIGEAPGAREMEAGEPFVGPSGARLGEWWHGCGLRRSDFYITNVVNDHQPRNIDAISQAEMEVYIDALHERLSKLERPAVIVPVGNYALYGLTGKGAVSWHHRDGRVERPGITSWRGSILQYTDRLGRTTKVVPAIHPAASFRTPVWGHISGRYDWPRIANEARFPDLYDIQREHYIKPSIADLREYADSIRSADYLAVDIETPMQVSWTTTYRQLKKCECGHMQARHDPGIMKPCNTKRCTCRCFTPITKGRKTKVGAVPYIGCIGFAASPTFSFTVPTTQGYWGGDYEEAMEYVKTICANEVPKVLQNGMFDALHLARNGIHLRGWQWDTRAMHHCLDALLPHDLAFLGSIHTRHPYWKDEAKSPEEISKYASNSEALWTYNGIDCCVTAEAFAGPAQESCEMPLRDRLDREGRAGFYAAHYAALFEPLQGMSLHGVRLDDDQRSAIKDDLVADCERIATGLLGACGLPVVAKKGISGPNLKYFLYGPKGVTEKQRETFAGRYPGARPLNLPLQYAKTTKRGPKTISANEVAVRRLTLRFPDKMGQIGPLILEHREKMQQQQFVGDGLADADGRVRCQFGFVTDTGRLNAQENPWRTGRNLQNIDRRLRGVYEPDKE